MAITDSFSNISRSKANNWLEKYARFGYFTKGVVYCLSGILAAMSAFKLGGQLGGSNESVRYIYDQPFGRILLLLVAIGLLGYVTWRFIQAIKDPRNKGTDAKGIASRMGYAFSGLTYLAFAFYAFKIVWNNSNNDGGGSSRQTLVDKALDLPLGQFLVGAIALFFIGKGLWQFYRAISGKFKKHLEGKGRSNKTYDITGRIGYSARGVVLLVIGYFFIRAAIDANPSEAQGTEQAFSFLQNTGGALLMGIVALGLAAYGVFMFVKARYEDLDVED